MGILKVDYKKPHAHTVSRSPEFLVTGYRLYVPARARPDWTLDNRKPLRNKHQLRPVSTTTGNC